MRPSAVPRPPPPDADAEQGHVGEDVAALEEAELLTDGERAPGAAGGQVDLAHVDLGARGLVAEEAGVVPAGLDLRSEAEVHAEVEVVFLALRIEHREGRQEAGAELRDPSPP